MRRTAAFTALWRALTAAHRGGPGLGARVASLPRMAWSSLRGDYDGSARFMMMSLATLYVVSPIDAVPEILLGPLGLIDDGIVVAWIVGTFLAETDRFIAWEQMYGKRARGHRPPPPRQESHPGQGSHARPESRPGQEQNGSRRYEDVVDGEVIP
jgi:uncharacterized membrane protein YkvA (DUF1232 family)